MIKGMSDQELAAAIKASLTETGLRMPSSREVETMIAEVYREPATSLAEGHWTYERPTEPGWYWYQEDPTEEPVALFYAYPKHSPGIGSSGRWSGPIPVPMAHEAWRPPSTSLPE